MQTTDTEANEMQSIMEDIYRINNTSGTWTISWRLKKSRKKMSYTISSSSPLLRTFRSSFSMLQNSLQSPAQSLQIQETKCRGEAQWWEKKDTFTRELCERHTAHHKCRSTPECDTSGGITKCFLGIGCKKMVQS